MREEFNDRGMRVKEGRLVCHSCGRPVRWGWVYRFGPITLATCNRTACMPRAPWSKGCAFSQAKGGSRASRLHLSGERGIDGERNR